MTTKSISLRLKLFTGLVTAMTSCGLMAQGSREAMGLIERVAEAIGGEEAILGIHTLEANGYGMEAYFWGGGNVTGDPDAAQKWAENLNGRPVAAGSSRTVACFASMNR